MALSRVLLVVCNGPELHDDGASDFGSSSLAG